MDEVDDPELDALRRRRKDLQARVDDSGPPEVSLNAELRRLRAEAHAPVGSSELSALVAGGTDTADDDLARARADLDVREISAQSC